MKQLILISLVLISTTCAAQILESNKLIGEDLSFQNKYYSEGLRKYQFKDFIGAIQDFNDAIKLAPNQASIYANRADAKFKLDDFRGAISDYNKAIEIKPNGYSYHRRGIAKLNLKDIVGAFQDFDLAIIEYEKEKLISSNVDFENEQISDIYLDRGNQNFYFNKYEEAIEEYSLAIKYSENSLAYFNRGINEIIIHKKDLACLDFSKAGELGLEKAYSEIRKRCN